MHSIYSDGSNPPEDYVLEAINQGFKGIGFSEHSPLPFPNTFALKQGNEKNYVDEIRGLRDKYKERISIWCGLEADYIPAMSDSLLNLKKQLELDYIIGSVHLVRSGVNEPGKNMDNGLVIDSNLWFIDGPRRETYDQGINGLFGGDARKAVTAYWHQVNSMVENEIFDVVGHLDKIKMHNQGRWFDENSDWYKRLVEESVELIAAKGLLVEVNTRGIYKRRSESLFPGKEILTLLKQHNVGLVLSSDAHHPSELSLYFNEALKILNETGYSSVWIYESGGWCELATVLPS